MARAGQTIRNRCTGEEITWVETAAMTGGERLSFRFVVNPGGRLTARHLHPMQEETFVLRHGVFAVEIGPERHMMAPGDRLHIPKGAVHRWDNPSAESQAELEVTFAPALNTEEFLEQFFGLGNAGRTAPDGTPSFLQIMTMVNRYQLFIDGPPVPVQRLMGWTIGGAARLLGYRPHDPAFDG
jgi:quercetin dioxygenase-like cupin family protein